ncbi:MFS transporter [Sporomusa termitida]|uniref:Multidrug resistance protein MdtD n=1 Tax=Sporomusa termitida TaxID=2377 RepID=A0A517DYZ3_9FIRM|nr:MFS transporter [Sporomusa termitida]QDR82466.1 Putative multidrug resistance protein MdtD [Sporomusa termitida]
MKLLWILGISGFLVNADSRAIAPVLPAIADDLMIREAAVGLLVSAFTIPYGLLQLVYGPIADKFGKLQTISVALFLFALAELACSYADSFTSLLVFRIFSGTFAAGIIPVSLAQIGDSFTFAERPKAISFFMSLSMSGQALGIVLGSMLAHFFSWKFIFLAIGLAGMLVGLAFLREKSRLVHIPPKEQIPLKERYKRIFASRRSRTVYLAVGLEGVVLFGGFTYLGVYGNKVLGLDYFSVGLLTAGFSVAAFIGSYFISPIIKQVGQHRMPLIGSSLLTCAFGLIWLIPHWGALLAGFLLLGLGFIVLHTTLQTYATELLPEARSTCMSLFAFFLFLGNGIGPAGLGWVYEAGGAQVMLAATTVSLLVYTMYCKLAFRQFAGSSIMKG